jgi:hypothetical protein
MGPAADELADEIRFSFRAWLRNLEYVVVSIAMDEKQKRRRGTGRVPRLL